MPSTEPQRDSQYYEDKIRKAWANRARAQEVIQTGIILIEAKQVLGDAKFWNTFINQLPFKVSSTQKLMKIARHSILGKPEYISTLPDSWTVLYDLSCVSNDRLQAAFEAGEINKATGHSDVSDFLKRPGEPEKEPGTEPRTSRSKIKLPNTTATTEELCRRGIMEMEGGMCSSAAAALIGVSQDAFSKMRDIVLLSDRNDLSEADKKLISAATREMNETKTVRGPYEKIKHIGERIWGTQRRGSATRQRLEERRLQDFADGMSVVVQAGLCGEMLTVPHLPHSKRKQFTRELRAGIASLRVLLRKIEESGK